MFEKKSLIVVFLALHLTISLKIKDFCLRKQEECKGYYDEKQIYKIKCNPIKCHGKIDYDCGSNLCSKGSSECEKYIKFDEDFKTLIRTKPIDPVLAVKHLEKRKKYNSFTKRIKQCLIKVYEFDSNDFCLNGKVCMETRKFLKGLGYHLVKKQVACKCSSELSFKCDKFCTKNSNACDFYKSNKNTKYFNNNINNCEYGNSTFFLEKVAK
jgi:hypothetical protein